MIRGDDTSAARYHPGMSTVELRKRIKKTIDRLPPRRLESLAEFAAFLDQQPLIERVMNGEKAIRSGKGVNWRKVRTDA